MGAIARGLILVSNDSDLLRVEGLSLELYLSHYYVNICNSVLKFFISLIAVLVAYT